MYSPEQVSKVLACYYQAGKSATIAVRTLGYPTPETIRKWLKTPPPTGRVHRKNRVLFTDEEKMAILHRCYDLGEDDSIVAAEIGISGSSVIRHWKKLSDRGRRLSAVPRKSKRGVSNPNRPPGDWSMIQEENEQLRLEVEILKETVKVLKKEPGVGSEELSNREKAVIVDALKKKTHRSLPTLLKILNLPRSSYYYAKAAADRPDRHVERRGRIRDIFASNYSCYGSRRIHAELKRQGDVVSEKIVRQLMREEGLVVRIRRYHPYTSYLGEISPAVPDHLERDFRAERPNEKWLTDITEFSIPAGKFYLSPILDCCGGNVVSWNGGPKPDAELANAALRNALGTLSDARPILHSDRGSHYRWPEWIRLVEENGLTRSMSRKGCSPDNSACEGFFGRLKNECFYGLTFMGMSLDEFKNYIDAYIVWYNERRIKLSLGGRSPAEYRAFEFGL